ncbi:MAG: phenylalanine--tRNA ligase subunit alpha [Spirochaetaceae bacterium]|nr:MAG: phenylalanine--tRNA ligase subunit alpha [Spirochaetaceae bacterium]
MKTDVDLKGLHPLEVRLLLEFSAGEQITASALSERLGYKVGQANQAVSWLEAKGLLVEAERTTAVGFELTELGAEYARTGTPEERIIALLRDRGPLRIPDITAALGLENKDVGSAYGSLGKAGALEMDGEKRIAVKDPDAATDVALIRTLLDRAESADGRLLHEVDLSDDERRVMESVSRKRGAASAPFRVIERETVTYLLTEDAAPVAGALAKAGITGQEIGQLTPEMIRDGSWRSATFRAYNINVPPAQSIIGRRNPYSAYLDEVKDKLVSLGFEQFDGSLVETEFWNSDALFMPQFHSARDIHDVYQLEAPTHAREIEEPYLSQVASAHENGWTTGSRGWRYGFDRDFTKRLILRSQGTAVSARTLRSAKVPGRYFGMLRCFRPDDVDATHLSDFYQTEGIVLGEDVNLKTLLGLLEMFAVEVAGATDVKYVPGYFPFTEPSIEVHIKHPVLGWFELGGSGIFRPEVTEPQGVSVPVLAWGLGIDRMALMKLGLDDLRELFTPDIQNVRRRRVG